MMAGIAEKAAVKPHKKQTEFARVMKQLRKNKVAMAGLIVMAAECLLALLSPWIIPYDYTAMDMFPTTLSAMGFEIEGDRLGLAVDLFSGEPTLCEEMGFEKLEEETQKYSAYYIKNFA